MRKDRLSAWLDDHDLLPGYDWDEAIRSAIQRSDAFIVCLSRRAVGKTGFIQKEIREALEHAERRPQGKVFIIPVRLESCAVPERLQRWQWIDLFKRGGYERLRRVLVAQVGLSTKKEPDSKATRPQFLDPADAVLYELCVSHGRCLYALIRRGRFGISQGHILVVRPHFPPPFREIKQLVEEYRRFSPDQLGSILSPGAPWRKPGCIVRSIRE